MTPIDWTQVLVAFIAGLPILLTAIGTLLITLRTQRETVTLKEHVNSKMDQFIEAKTAVATLEGENTGRLAEQARVK